MNATSATTAETKDQKLPVGALLAFATVVFIGCVTETLPAGVLLEMSADLKVTESQAGQLVTVYAISTAATSVPLTLWTRRLPRRALLVSLILGFALVSAVTAISTVYAVTLVTRILAGAVSGVMWSMIPGYAMRISPRARAGKALALAMVGTPIGFAVGVPAGTMLGDLVGWRYTFGLMVVITVALVGWVLWRVPPLAGERVGHGGGARRTFAVPGLAAVLAATFVYVLGHNILYTYLGPVLADVSWAGLLGFVLLVFGVTSVLGIWIVGATIDRRPRALALAATAGFAVASALLGFGAQWSIVLLFGAVALWGLAFGGSPTMFPAAAARVAGQSADLAQSMAITVWNLAIAGGGLIGGIILSGPSGAKWLPVSAAGLGLAALIMVAAARRGFPPRSKTPTA